MNCNRGHRPSAFLILSRCATKIREENLFARKGMPGPSFRLSTLDCELLALTMSTHATPMFTLTDSASRPEISALDRAGSLEMQTHQECPPRWISPLECTDTKNAPASPLECTDRNSLDLKSFRFHSYKKHPGGPCLPVGGHRSSRPAARIEFQSVSLETSLPFLEDANRANTGWTLPSVSPPSHGRKPTRTPVSTATPNQSSRVNYILLARRHLQLPVHCRG